MSKIKSRTTQRRWLIGYLRPYRWRLIFALVMQGGNAGIGLAFPALIQSIVDTVINEQDTTSLNKITLFAFAGLIIFTLSAIAGLYHINYIGEHVVIDIRKQLYSHLHTLSMGFFAEQRIGELVSRLSNDVARIRQTITDNAVDALQYTVAMVGALLIMLWVNLQLTFFVLAVLPIVMGIGLFLGYFSLKDSTKVQLEVAASMIIANEGIQNIREVKSFVRSDYEVQRYVNALERSFTHVIGLVWVRAVLRPIMRLIFYTGTLAILWYSAHEVLAGRLTGGELVAFLLYMVVIGQSIAQVSHAYTQIQETLGATERIFDLLSTQPIIQDLPNAQPLPAVAGKISFVGVGFRYEENQWVLQDINLEIKAGEIIALVGPSGAGKSTLFNLIPRFYDVSEGVLKIDDVDVKTVTQASLRAQVGIVPQESLLFGGTIRENILYGRLDATEDEMIAAAQAANAHDFVTQLPDGYETMVGERGVRLSGGQRQRVAIARAILKDPRILLLDEATASLDNESEHLVQSALERLMQNRTTVIIAHRLSTVRIAHRIAVLDQGRMIELGTHAELMALGGLYAKLYDMQFRQQDLFGD